MSEIIKAGKQINPDWLNKKLECGKCGCMWKLTIDDEVSHNYYEPDIAITYCPNCNKKIVFADYSLYK